MTCEQRPEVGKGISYTIHVWGGSFWTEESNCARPYDRNVPVVFEER